MSVESGTWRDWNWFREVVGCADDEPGHFRRRGSTPAPIVKLVLPEEGRPGPCAVRAFGR